MKSSLWKSVPVSRFPTLKTKQFPFAASVDRAGILLTVLRGVSVLIRAACPYSDLPNVFQG